MHIKKGLPTGNFTKINNAFWTLDISDGAKVLFGFLVSLPNGKTIHDGYLAKCLGVSGKTISNRKRELKGVGLILMVQLAPRVHDLYIGCGEFNALQVKDRWEDNNE